MPDFTAPDGWRLHYTQQGAGPLVLVLPGSTSASAHHHQDLLRLSQHQYQAVSLDFRGTGKSGRIAVWPDDWWQQNARDAAALITHLGYEQAAVIGTSGGGIAALWCAILFPDKVRAVIADSIGHHLPPDFLRGEIANRRRYAPESVGFWHAAHGDDWQAVVEADCEFLLRQADQGAGWYGESLSQLRCPVLLTGSLHDEFYPDLPEQAGHMARQIPDAQVFLVNGGSHPLIWSRADDFYDAALPFLTRRLRS